MPTENEKEIESTKIYLKAKEDENWKELGMCKELKTEDFEADNIEKDKINEIINGFECTIRTSLLKNEFRRFQKTLGIENIKRKRAKKILMSKGIQRNEAELVVKVFNEYYGEYIHGLVLTIAKALRKNGG